MKIIKSLFLKEFKIFFGSYTAILVLCGISFLNSLFVLILDINGRTNYNDALLVTIISLMITTIISMFILSIGSFTDEKNQNTTELLFTLPISDFQILFSKFIFGTFLCFIVTFIINLFFPILLLYYWKIPVYLIFSSSIGLFLLGIFVYNIGILSSILSKNQIISLLISVSIFFSLWLIGYFSHLFDSKTRDILFHFHIFSHFIGFTKGVLPLKSISFFISGIFLFFYLSLKLLESRKWQN